jgi:hypothetical protein
MLGCLSQEIPEDRYPPKCVFLSLFNRQIRNLPRFQNPKELYRAAHSVLRGSAPRRKQAVEALQGSRLTFAVAWLRVGQFVQPCQQRGFLIGYRGLGCGRAGAGFGAAAVRLEFGAIKHVLHNAITNRATAHFITE